MSFSDEVVKPSQEKELQRIFDLLNSKASIEELKASDIIVDTQDKRGDSSLHLVTKGGWHEARTPGFIYAGPDSNLFLQWASVSDKKQAIEKLLELGADPNQINNYGETPLHLASMWGDLEILNLFLDEENVNVKDNQKQTPLHKAAVEAHPKVIERLVEMGADLNAMDDFRSTPLSYASDWADKKTMKLLMDEETMNWNFNDEFGLLPLSNAIMAENEEAFKILAHTEAERDRKDNREWSDGYQAEKISSLRNILKVIFSGKDKQVESLETKEPSSSKEKCIENFKVKKKYIPARDFKGELKSSKNASSFWKRLGKI